MGIKERAIDFLLYRSCNSARTFIVMSSAVFGVILALNPDGLNPIMGDFADAAVWSLMFGTHAAIGFVNINSKIVVSYPEACLGFLVWSISTMCVLITPGAIPASIAPNVVCAILSWWILIRVGVKNG